MTSNDAVQAALKVGRRLQKRLPILSHYLLNLGSAVTRLSLHF
jgi:hypothetical protein